MPLIIQNLKKKMRIDGNFSYPRLFLRTANDSSTQNRQTNVSNTVELQLQ